MKLTKNQTAARTLADMYRALDAKRPVTFTYAKKNGEVTVRTLELFDIRTTKSGDVTLRGMDRQSGEARTFLLSGVTAYTLHRGTYQIARPEADRPAPVAPTTVAALVAYEIARDERTTRRYAPAA